MPFDKLINQRNKAISEVNPDLGLDVFGTFQMSFKDFYSHVSPTPTGLNSTESVSTTTYKELWNEMLSSREDICDGGSLSSTRPEDLTVGSVFMNARDYGDIRKLGRGVLDIESQTQLLLSGLMATLWGAQIIVSREIPNDAVLVCLIRSAS